MANKHRNRKAEEEMKKEDLKEENMNEEAESVTEETDETAAPEDESAEKTPGDTQEPAEEEAAGDDYEAEEEEPGSDEKLDAMTDRLKRTMAEFENFRKRSEREKSQMYDMGARDVITKILPVLDNFERGLQTIPEEDKEHPVATGMELIYKAFITALEGMGVKPIEAVGKPFDPEFHNAVMHVEDENAGENMVVEEFQKGYLYKDSVIRYSMVKVAN